MAGDCACPECHGLTDPTASPEEAKRRATNRELLRAFLLANVGAWIKAWELVQVAGLRFGARLYELRHAEGFAVECIADGPRTRYRLTLARPQTEEELRAARERWERVRPPWCETT